MLWAHLGLRALFETGHIRRSAKGKIPNGRRLECPYIRPIALSSHIASRTRPSPSSYRNCPREIVGQL